MAPKHQRKRKRTVSNKPKSCLENMPNAIVFSPPPQRLLDIAGHETLLRRLGLWDFLNLDFHEPIQEHLIKELILSYQYLPNKYIGESCVGGVTISLDRTTVANALRLPVERAAKDWTFPVTKDETSFLEELISHFLALRDEGEAASVVFDKYVFNYVKGLKEMCLQKIDWAGLIWCMMQREMLNGSRNKLFRCYYSSHMQLVCRHQRPELFHDGGGDQVIESGSQVCQDDRVDSLEMGAKPLLKLQVDLNVAIHSSDQDDGMMQNEENEAARDGSTDHGLKVHYMEENYLVQDEADKGVCKANSEVHHLKEDDVVLQGSEAHTGNSLNVHCINNEETHDEVVKKDSTTDGLESLGSQETENQPMEVSIIENQDLPELEFINATEMNRDSIVGDIAGDEMDCQEADNVGTEVESGASVDLLVTLEAHDDVVKYKSSPDALDTKKIENHQKVDIADEFLHVEMDHGGAELGLTQSDKEDDAHKVHRFQVELNTENHSSEKEDELMHNEANEEVDDCPEVNMSGLVDDNRKEAKSAASVDLSGTQEALGSAVLKEQSSDGLIQQKKVNAIENQHQSEVEIINATEMSKGGLIADVAGDAMDCQELVLNCMVDNARIEIESGTSVDLMVNKDTSTDGLDSQKLENQQREVLIIEDQYTPEYELDLNSEAKVNGGSGDNVYGDEAYNARMEVESGASVDLLVVQESHDDLMKNKGSTNGLDKIENRALHLDSCQENSGNKLMFGDKNLIQQRKVINLDEHLDLEMDHNGGADLGLIPNDREDDAQKIHRFQNHVPEGQQVGRQVDKYVPEGYKLQQCTSNMMELDLDHCAEQFNAWTGRFAHSARRKVEEKKISNLMLQMKIEEQNRLIQQYQFKLQEEQQKKQQYQVMLHEEQQQNQASIRAYKRELYMMQNVLEDYRKANKQARTAFAEYRERVQLPEEPLYMPHPDGGGDVIHISEWKKLEEERQKKAFKDMVDGVELEIRGFMDEELITIDQYCDRLAGLEHQVQTMSKRL